MSAERAWLLATRDKLRGVLNLDDAVVDVTPEGMPHPDAGELFISVHELSVQGIEIEGISGTIGFMVTITKRITDPQDKIGQRVIADEDGLLIWSGRVKKIIDMDPPIMVNGKQYQIAALANAYYTESSGTEPVNTFIEPPRFKTSGPSQLKDASWFFSPAATGDWPYVGVAKVLIFGGATYFQTVESQEG